ncbi:MFS transporter [Curtobacterium citreum]|uniref:MFS transporter n=1 Tax=Curtobacterium citreum TaxID=2036 RepID=A0ABT2HIK7_9MICO|nr:MFS transporter [Curtobacterium citreum]MCS6523108.1 MFS transporter [Curtobacterium citreum]TQJ26780.1 putative MFS family arabinose efflux permease [Curtobacterium citreum]GGL82539.1 MFS transporter [Curtobacterium citreum]
MTRARTLTSFVVLSMTGGVIFQVAYIRFVFLADTAHALGLSVQRYGEVTSVFGAVAVVMYFCGGWFADRFPPKVLIVVALAGMGAVDLYLASVPGETGVVVAHVLMAVLGMGLYWSSLVKLVSMLGSADQQGTLFGWLEGVRGITSTIVGFVGAGIVAAAIAETVGVLWVMRIYGVLCLLSAVLVLVVVRTDRSALAQVDRQAVSLRELAAAVRNKYTWLIGGSIMLMYCFYTLLGYLTPLLQDGFAVPVVLLGAIGVVRTYVFQIVGGPVGGVLVDRWTGSSPAFLRWAFVVAAVSAVGFLVLPHDPALVGVAVALMVVMCLAVFTSRGVYWAQVGEVEVPLAQRGGVIGLASGIAYLPDAFLPALGAWWVGDPANGVPQQGGGYTAMFAVLVVAAVLGVLLTTVTMRVRARDLRSRPADDVVVAA